MISGQRKKLKKQLRGLRSDYIRQIAETVLARLRGLQELDIYRPFPSPNPGQGDLCDWIEEWQDKRVERNGIVASRSMHAITQIVQEQCERFPDLLQAVIEGNKGRIAVEYVKLALSGQSIFGGLIVQKATALLDNECVEAYRTAHKKASKLE